MRYAIPVPVRGRGPFNVGFCLKVGGAPGGSTPEDKEFEVVRTCPCDAVAGRIGSLIEVCGFDSVR